MQFVYDTLKAQRGMEAMVVMPARGARVGAWIESLPAKSQIGFARKAMNMSGSDKQPVLFKVIDPGDQPPADWRRWEVWADDEAGP